MKSIYFFGNGKADGSAAEKNLLGGKGANLAEMTSLGIPVPPGFTISTDVCTYYMESDNYPDITCVCSFWCQAIYARYDGDGLKCWSHY